MRVKPAVLFYILPTLILIFIIAWRKGSIIGFNGPVTVVAPGVYKVDGHVLDKSQIIWTNRVYLPVGDNDPPHHQLESLIESLSLSETQKAAARKSCWAFIKSYSTGDWNTFQSFRIPTGGYDIQTNAVADLAGIVPGTNTNDPISLYRAVWESMFKTNGLFEKVCVDSNSISLFVLPVKEMYPAAIFPASTDRGNQIWMASSPIDLFYYSNFMVRNPGNVPILRFFFYGKSGKLANLYLVTLVWDEGNGVWLPWSVNVAFTRPATHQLIVF